MRSIRTKSLHGVVQGLCVLAGIETWELLHRAPVDLERGGEQMQGEGARRRPVPVPREGKGECRTEPRAAAGRDQRPFGVRGGRAQPRTQTLVILFGCPLLASCAP